MNEKQLFDEINKEADINVPDNYSDILNSAKAEGLLDNISVNANVYSDSDTVILGGMKKRLTAIAALACVVFVSFIIVIALAFNSSNNDDIIPPTGIALDLGEDYAIGAVSTAKLLGGFIGNASETVKTPLTKRMSFKSSYTDETDLFLNYFSAYDTFFGTSMAQPVKVPLTSSKYANSVKIEGMRANGDKINYEIDYTEAKIVDNSAQESDTVKYYLEGVISAGYGQMLLLGERTVMVNSENGTITNMYICAYSNIDKKDTYVRMDAEYSSENGVAATKYNYTVVLNGDTAGGAVLYRPVQDTSNSDIAFVLDILGVDGAEDVLYDVKRPEAGGSEFSVNYKSKYDVGNFNVLITKSDYACVKSDLLIYKLNGDGTCEIAGYDKNAYIPEKLAIPSSYDGNKVTAIGRGAFEYCSDLKTVCIAEGIEIISDSAFMNSYVQKIELPQSLKKIEDIAFYDCPYIKDVDLPEQLETIGSSVFGHCSSIEKLNIPASVTSIGSTITIGSSVITSLTVDADNTVYEGKGNCIVEKSTKKLITGCRNSIIPNDGSVEIIGNGSFSNCPVSSIVIPEGVKVIENVAFYNSGLESVSLPESLDTIMGSAFGNCAELTSLHIPSGVKQLELRFLSSCDAIESLTVDAGNAFYCSSQNCIIEKQTKKLIVGCKDSVIPSDGSVKIIGEDAFIGLYSLNHIEIPASINCIESGAFSYTGLESIQIPDTVTDIGGYLFMHCYSLSDVKLPQNMTEIPFGMFADCFSLESITIPDSVEVIKNGAFAECQKLKNIELPLNITCIEPEAFINCTVLESFVIPNKITEIGDRTFHNCSSLESITIPVSVTHICFQAFYGCGLLKEINFGGTVDEWNAIIKDTGWYFAVTDCTVNCSDGTVTIDWFEDLDN